MKALSDNICIGLDASNIKSGGGITHLLNLLRSSDPRKHGITKVVVWAGKNTLSLLPRYDWLRSVSTDYIDMSLPFRTWWQQMLLPGCLTREGCDLLFSPGGLSPRRLSVPVVTMFQNLLPFDPHEMARYGLSPVGIRLRLLRRLQEESFKKSDGVIFLTHYAAKTVQSCIRGDIHGKIGIIPHGVEHIFYNEPRPVSPVSFINDFNSFRLLYVSIVDMYKHQWNVVEAVGRLRTKGLPLTVDFVGSA